MNQKGKLTKELNQAATYVIEMEEKVYKSNKISLNLLAKLKDAESELGKWPKLFTQITFTGPYAYNPMKNDQIDILLAEFVNIHP